MAYKKPPLGKRAALAKCIPFCRRDEKNRRFVSFGDSRRTRLPASQKGITTVKRYTRSNPINKDEESVNSSTPLEQLPVYVQNIPDTPPTKELNIIDISIGVALGYTAMNAIIDISNDSTNFVTITAGALLGTSLALRIQSQNKTTAD